jgi:DNA-binding response OmpR family regulator
MSDKILVVEGNPLIAEAIEETTGRFRVRTERAIDGWDAIGKLETEEYAAIVIDSDLPLHSGFGVLTYLREEVGDDLDNVIVVTSGNCDDVQRKFGRVTVVARDDVAKEIERSLGRRL